MKFVLVFCGLVGVYPWWRAWWFNRETSLVYAINWGVTAWFSWIVIALFADVRTTGMEPARYVALTLSGCAGIAVLGARRPQAFAWNFVVIGLLAMMMLPLAEGMIVGQQPLDPMRTFFLACLLAVVLLNYLPTRFGWWALLFALCCAGELWVMLSPDSWWNQQGLSALHHVTILLLPVLAWWHWHRQPPPMSQFDKMWRVFRDRYGLIWGQRVREQFNRAAINAGWPVYLRWRGLVRTLLASVPPDDYEQDVIDAFVALTKRFNAPQQF